MNARRCTIAAAALLLLAGCSSMSGTHDEAPELAMLRTLPPRVAVMPFAVSAPPEGFLAASLAPVGELLALEASRGPAMQGIGDLLQNDVVTWLQQSDFEVLDPWHVATQLTHAGVPDVERRDPAQAARLAAALSVDAVLFGDVQRWNRSYYVVQSTVEVALHLELRAADGKLLFRTDRTETYGAGLTGGPTGYLSAVTEPIAGLSGSHLRELTRNVARDAIVDLNGGMLGAQPAATAPRLALVALAREHDGPFVAGERVDVMAVGSPDCDVRFDLGCLRTEVPMRQTAVTEDPRGARATYVGHYVVDAVDRGDELPVLCTIQRGTTRRPVATRYRFDGTVSLGGALGR